MAFLADLRLFLVALWLGAALFFSAVVAPGAFSVLRAAHVPNAGDIAGTLVTRTLSVVNVGGFIISLFLLVMLFAFRRGYEQRAFVLEIISLIAISAATGIGHWVVAAKMRALRVAMVLPIDQVPTHDPRRLAFNNLHGYSVSALSIGMIAALVAFMLVARRTRLNAR